MLVYLVINQQLLTVLFLYKKCPKNAGNVDGEQHNLLQNILGIMLIKIQKHMRKNVDIPCLYKKYLS